MILRWQNRTNGTGTILSTVDLSVDGSTAISGDYTPVPDEILNKVQVRAFYFPSGDETTEYDSNRAAIAGRVEALKTALKFKPPTVKRLARGVAVMPNIYNNFGDLVYGPSSPYTVILANCCLLDISVEEDTNASGMSILMTFGKVAAALT